MWAPAPGFRGLRGTEVLPKDSWVSRIRGEPEDLGVGWGGALWPHGLQGRVQAAPTQGPACGIPHLGRQGVEAQVSDHPVPFR